jgi:hypothetical protein
MNWREYLTVWKQKNELKVPKNLEKDRQNFIKRFPKNKLFQLTVEEYSLNHPKFLKDNFCYWLKFKIKDIDDTKNKDAAYGIYWKKKDNQWKWHRKLKAQTYEDAFSIVKTGILSLIDAVEQDRLEELDTIAFNHFGTEFNRIPQKILYIYFPRLFFPDKTYALDLFLNKQPMLSFIPFCDPQKTFDKFNLSIYFGYLDHALFYSMVMNHELCKSFKCLPEFQEMDTYNVGIFLNDLKHFLDQEEVEIMSNSCSQDNFMKNTNCSISLLDVLWRSMNRKKILFLMEHRELEKHFLLVNLLNI